MRSILICAILILLAVRSIADPAASRSAQNSPPPVLLICPVPDQQTLDELTLVPELDPGYKAPRPQPLALQIWRIPQRESHAMHIARVTRDIGNGQNVSLFLGGMYLLGGKSGRQLAVKSAVACVETTAITLFLKRMIGRGRPTDGKERGTIHGPSTEYDSFPSGHTALAFTLASIYAREDPHTALLVYPIATSVGWSRIYLQAHWVEDVVVGAAIGYLVGKSQH